MIINVVNKDIRVQTITVIAVASSSSILIGDTQSMTLAVAFDTPPESLIAGEIVVPTGR